MTDQHEAQRSEQSTDVASTEYPTDRFDMVPNSGRVGAHRVTAQPRIVWLYVFATLAGAALLTAIGIIGVNLANSSGSLPPLPSETQEIPAEPQITAELDPEASVVLLDGTSAQGELALRLAPVITSEKFGVILAAVPAASADVEISAVFYADPADEAAALGLANELGGISTYSSTEYTDYGARLVVLLGSDYAGPAKDAN
ncbi:MAG: LytR C-terminal domain-containing protein [Leucobacter sp.]